MRVEKLLGKVKKKVSIIVGVRHIYFQDSPSPKSSAPQAMNLLSSGSTYIEKVIGNEVHIRQSEGDRVPQIHAIFPVIAMRMCLLNRTGIAV